MSQTTNTSTPTAQVGVFSTADITAQLRASSRRFAALVGQITDEHDIGDISIRPQPDGTVNVDGGVAIRDGWIDVPTGPGLGVTPDESLFGGPILEV